MGKIIIKNRVKTILVVPLCIGSKNIQCTVSYQ